MRVAPATFTVANLNDAGQGSLRQAVLDANATPALDTIVFKAGLTGLINLSTGIMNVSAPLTIKGPGSTKIIISGGNMSGIFAVTDGDPNKDSPFSISGLSLIDGNASSGGAINGGSETLTVLNCLFASNVSSLNGGAISAGGAKISVINSQFTGNQAPAGTGGAIFASAKTGLSIVKSYFSGNAAVSGGGLSLSLNAPTPTAKILVSACTLVHNDAISNGGGLLIDFNDDVPVAVVQNSVITGNSAGNHGGGLYFDRGNLTVTKTTFVSNSADAGGGAFLDRSKTVSITASKFLGNSATDSDPASEGGGALVLDQGAIPDSGIYKMTANTLVGNSSAVSGGAITLVTGASLSLTGGLINANRAGVDGGGIYTNGTGSDASPLTVKSATISENIASGRGGGIAAVGGGTVTITAVKFLANKAGDGGGAYLRSEGTVSVVSSLFQLNGADTVGGGFHTASLGTFTFTSVKVLQNFAEATGGGFAASSNFTISKSLVSGNLSRNTGGGANTGTNVTIQKTIITNNVAGTSGGGLFTNAAPTISPDSKIFGNIAPASPDID
jgi:predicted outer membrane repeat protein